MNLTDILTRYQIVSFIPMVKTVFSSASIPSQIKLSGELVRINYSKLSSIKNPEIIYCIENNQINLWFFEKNVFPKTPIIIPESYLIFKALKELDTAIVVFQTNPVKVFILKDGQYKVAAIVKKNKDLFIELAGMEYGISKVLYFEQTDYDRMYQLQKKSIKIKDLYRFFQRDIFPENILAYSIERFTYPAVIFIVIFILMTYGQTILMEQKVETLTQTYHTLKQKNQTIKKAINTHNKNVEKLKTFANEELMFQDPVVILSSMYDVFLPEDNTTIKQFRQHGERISLQVESEGNPVKYLNRLNKTGNFSNVIIKDSFAKKDNKKILIYDLHIKKLNNGY